MSFENEFGGGEVYDCYKGANIGAMSVSGLIRMAICNKVLRG
jgi:hypothetical protein